MGYSTSEAALQSCKAFQRKILCDLNACSIVREAAGRSSRQVGATPKHNFTRVRKPHFKKTIHSQMQCRLKADASFFFNICSFEPRNIQNLIFAPEMACTVLWKRNFFLTWFLPQYGERFCTRERRREYEYLFGFTVSHLMVTEYKLSEVRRIIFKAAAMEWQVGSGGVLHYRRRFCLYNKRSCKCIRHGPHRRFQQREL
jgi:hypothetical protein